MIRCVRIWTDERGTSVFEEGSIDLSKGERGDELSDKSGASTISFQETQPGGSFEWHHAPVRQLVLMLAGTLEFQTRDNGSFLMRPGDVLLAEDTTGSGHRWRLTDAAPWRRAYVILEADADARFVPNPKR